MECLLRSEELFKQDVRTKQRSAALRAPQTKSPGSICIEPGPARRGGLAFACVPQAGLSAL